MYITQDRLREIIREELRTALKPADELLVGVNEIANYLHLSSYTVRQQALRHDLPGFKVGGEWRFYISEIRAHLAQPSVVDPGQRSPRSRAGHEAAGNSGAQRASQGIGSGQNAGR